MIANELYTEFKVTSATRHIEVITRKVVLQVYWAAILEDLY